MGHSDLEILRQMKEKIDCIEQAAQQLISLGRGVPAVEKNTRIVLSAIHNLKFGVSDIVDVQGS